MFSHMEPRVFLPSHSGVSTAAPYPNSQGTVRELPIQRSRRVWSKPPIGMFGSIAKACLWVTPAPTRCVRISPEPFLVQRCCFGIIPPHVTSPPWQRKISSPNIRSAGSQPGSSKRVKKNFSLERRVRLFPFVWSLPAKAGSPYENARRRQARRDRVELIKKVHASLPFHTSAPQVKKQSPALIQPL